MLILKYTKRYHKEIIHAAVEALRAGKIVAYPTDTSYGLACDPTNKVALTRLYKIKERLKTQPVHIIPPSVAFAKKIVRWNNLSDRLAKKFWPGPLTLVLALVSRQKYLSTLASNGSFIGLRYPDNQLALDLAMSFGKPIPATSANPSAHLSGGRDSYSGRQVFSQFSKQKYKPDIIIDAGTLPHRKPSTFVKINGDRIEILRKGPISERQIQDQLNKLSK